MKSIWCCISLSGGDCQFWRILQHFLNWGQVVPLCFPIRLHFAQYCHGRPLHIKDITNNLVFVVIPIEKGIVQISLTSVFPTFSYPTYFVGIWVWIGLQMESLDNLAWDYILTTPTKEIVYLVTFNFLNYRDNYVLGLLMKLSWISLESLNLTS